MKKWLILISLLVICGCATSNHLISVLNQNPNLTANEVIQKLGKPNEIAKITPDSFITCHLYGTPRRDQVAVYFVDNKLYRYGRSNGRFHVTTLYNLGLITQDEYRWRIETIQQDELTQRMYQSQEDALAMQMFMGMQSLNLQQQQLNLQKRQAYRQTFTPIQYNPPQLQPIINSKSYTIKTQYYDLNPNDGLMNPGSPSNPYVVEEK